MELEKYLNKSLTVFYQDFSSVSRKDGKLIAVGNQFITILYNSKEILIPISSIIRIEADNHD